jgi:hypothetical protein
MHDMRLCEFDRKEIVNVCWEALETSFISHEAVDVNEQQGSPPISA